MQVGHHHPYQAALSAMATHHDGKQVSLGAVAVAHAVALLAMCLRCFVQRVTKDLLVHTWSNARDSQSTNVTSGSATLTLVRNHQRHETTGLFSDNSGGAGDVNK